MMRGGDGQAAADNEQVIPLIPPFPLHPGHLPAVPPNQHKLIDVPSTRTKLIDVQLCRVPKWTQIDRFPPTFCRRPPDRVTRVRVPAQGTKHTASTLLAKDNPSTAGDYTHCRGLYTLQDTIHTAGDHTLCRRPLQGTKHTGYNNNNSLLNNG